MLDFNVAAGWVCFKHVVCCWTVKSRRILHTKLYLWRSVSSLNLDLLRAYNCLINVVTWKVQYTALKCRKYLNVVLQYFNICIVSKVHIRRWEQQFLCENPQICSQLTALKSSDSFLHHISSSYYWLCKLNLNQFLLLHSSDKCWGMKIEIVTDRNTWSDSDFLLSSRCVSQRNFSCSLSHTRTEELESDTHRV